MTHPDPKAYVLALPLPDAGPQFESLESAPDLGNQQDAVAVGAQLAEFSPSVSPAQRSAVADCLLLAQLAANKATAQDPDLLAWYRKYVEVLQSVGWNVDSMSLEDKEIGDTDLDVHQAIIPVLAELLGPAAAAASMVVSVLKGLQQMDKDSPWITLFDRASQHAAGAKFQLGFVDVPAGDTPSVSIRLLVLAIDAKRSITQVLFFKFSDQQARLRTGQTQLGILDSRLDDIREAVASRVGPFLRDNIGKIEI